MAIPASPLEANGSKIWFAVDDNGGTLRANLIRGYRHETVDGQDITEIGVYQTSGDLITGYVATSGGTEMALSGGSIPCSGVIVKADPDNTEDVWVGPTGLTSNKSAGDGYRLSQGESVGLPCRDAASVFILRGGSVNVGVYFVVNVN